MLGSLALEIRFHRCCSEELCFEGFEGSARAWLGSLSRRLGARWTQLAPSSVGSSILVVGAAMLLVGGMAGGLRDGD
jgi:hypothetical protein